MTLIIISVMLIIAINIAMCVSESRTAKKLRELRKLSGGVRTEEEVMRMKGETWQDYANRVLGINNQRKDKE